MRPLISRKYTSWLMAIDEITNTHKENYAEQNKEPKHVGSSMGSLTILKNIIKNYEKNSHV